MQKKKETILAFCRPQMEKGDDRPLVQMMMKILIMIIKMMKMMMMMMDTVKKMVVVVMMMMVKMLMIEKKVMMMTLIMVMRMKEKNGDIYIVYWHVCKDFSEDPTHQKFVWLTKGLVTLKL